MAEQKALRNLRPALIRLRARRARLNAAIQALEAYVELQLIHPRRSVTRKRPLTAGAA